MAISIASLKKMNVSLPPLLLVYGVAGIGKTSLALEFPNVAYIQIAPERPPVDQQPMTFGELNQYQQVVEALGALYQEEHNIKTVVIDSLDALEPLIWQETCLRNSWKDIEQPGYGKGYVAADYVWRDIIAGCEALRRDRGMTVIWLALTEASAHEEPGSQPYKRYDLKIHKRAESLTTQAADAVLFVNTKVAIKETDTGFGKKQAHAEGGGTRWLFTDGRPAFVAKNRFAMPDALPIPQRAAYDAIAKYLPGHQPEQKPASSSEKKKAA